LHQGRVGRIQFNAFDQGLTWREGNRYGPFAAQLRHTSGMKPDFKRRALCQMQSCQLARGNRVF
jgi:hypothetical protein